MMKIIKKMTFILCVAGALAAGENQIKAGDIRLNSDLLANIKAELILPFFQALKEGDIKVIKNCIAGREYNSKKTLLEKNVSYPDFLRDFYKDASFKIKKIYYEKGAIIVDALIEFPEGITRNFSMRLERGWSGCRGNECDEFRIVETDSA
jgi:hypothetical protein